MELQRLMYSRNLKTMSNVMKPDKKRICKLTTTNSRNIKKKIEAELESLLRRLQTQVQIIVPVNFLVAVFRYLFLTSRNSDYVCSHQSPACHNYQDRLSIFSILAKRIDGNTCRLKFLNKKAVKLQPENLHER